MTETFEFELGPVQELAKLSEGAPLGEILAHKALEARKKKKPPVDLFVPLDGDWLVRFSAIIPRERRQKWGTLSDESAFSMAVLTTQCEGIFLCGQEWIEDGVPVTFTHPAFVAFFEAQGPREAIETLYGGADGAEAAWPDIEWVVSKILQATGMGERDKRGVPLV